MITTAAEKHQRVVNNDTVIYLGVAKHDVSKLKLLVKIEAAIMNVLSTEPNPARKVAILSPGVYNL